jgi:hypothetical protein
MIKDDCNSRNSWSRQMFSIALLHISDIYKDYKKYKKYIRSFSFYTILLSLQETEEAQL